MHQVDQKLTILFMTRAVLRREPLFQSCRKKIYVEMLVRYDLICTCVNVCLTLFKYTFKFKIDSF
ncbi:hypothetical protein JN27_00660 [Massilia sp. BSC265]|nr:hypothetical protein JN27_00660 [Massilia sp. BSC265]